MKKFWIIVLCGILLTSCGAAPTFETVADDILQPAMAPVSEILLTLPEDAGTQVMQEENGDRVYLCDGYTVTVQTLNGGDMERTVRQLSGFSSERLTILETMSGDLVRRDWVWTAAGEEGDQICRAAVLDDGTYHYCVTAVGERTDGWNEIFASVTLQRTVP